jgi:multidrug efflux system outer membrane protein
MPPSVPAGIPCDLLERRPDLRQAEQRVVAANAEVGIAITNFLPTIDLTAGAGLISPALSKITNTGTWGVWNLGAGLNGPIFQGGRLVGVYKETKARWQETVFEYEKTALNAFGEVANALSARQKFAQARVQQEKQVDALQQSVKLASDRYTIGISTYYEVLEAQQQLFPAEVSLTQTRLNQLLAVVNLYKALGGGWMDDCGPKSKPLAVKR